MARAFHPRALGELRERIAHLEGGAARKSVVVPFGVSAIDERLPGGATKARLSGKMMQISATLGMKRTLRAADREETFPPPLGETALKAGQSGVPTNSDDRHDSTIALVGAC